MIPCWSHPLYKWCEYNNWKDIGWIVLKYSIHIGCDSAPNCLTFHGHVSKVKVKASEKVMIYFNSSMLTTSFKVNQSNLVWKYSPVDCLTKRNLNFFMHFQLASDGLLSNLEHILVAIVPQVYYLFKIIGNDFSHSYFGMPSYEGTRETFCCEQLHLLASADFPNFVI